MKGEVTSETVSSTSAASGSPRQPGLPSANRPSWRRVHGKVRRCCNLPYKVGLLPEGGRSNLPYTARLLSGCVAAGDGLIWTRT